MSTFPHAIIGSSDGTQIITVFSAEWDAPKIAPSDHPNYHDIVDAAEHGGLTADEMADLFSLEAKAAEYFEKLTDRVSVSNGVVYLDGDPVHSSLTKAILGFMDEGNEQWVALVNFFENVQANPNAHSREQLYEWLERRDFSITLDGDLVGYKGVASDHQGGYCSIHSGRAIVNGQVVTGRIPNAVGDEIEMPRSEVHSDPSVGCHTGLHVGTFDFAQSYSSGGAMLKVYVNPRDVVSVPTDCDAAKVRVCRYYVADIIDAPVDGYLDHDPVDVDDEWGDGEDWDF